MLQRISCRQGQSLITDPSICWLDIRAQADFLDGHIPGALHMSQPALSNFIQTTAKTTPLIVYCYHGISSQRVGQYLLDAGFSHVSSLDGGFSDWHQQFPHLIAT